ncbi:MAG TPA: FtsX-like permease family protein [Gemmatimonadaceae bacterium]
MSRWRFIASLAWRDARPARRRLLLFTSSISIGVAALVAIDSYSANVVRSVSEQSRSILGADLSLSSRQPFTATTRSLIDSLDRSGVGVDYATTFASMALVPRVEGTRLVQVHATGPNLPFYGRIDTDPAGRWATLQTGRNALVDASLLTELGARTGDTLALGESRFAIIGTLRNVPGDVGIAAALGPRVYIAQRYVAETGLLGFGSRAEYEALLQLPAGTDADRFEDDHRTTLRDEHVRARTVRDTERSLTRGVDQLHSFLGVVGLVALLLGGIGVASAIRAYVAEKTDAIAMLRCVGASSSQVLAIYLLQAAALGLAGAAVGAALGVAAQFALPQILGDFIPVDVRPALEPMAIAAGLALGVWVAAIFALIPLLAVRHVTPLQALRREAAPATRHGAARDPWRWAALLALATSIVAIAMWRTGDAQRGAVMSAGIGVVLLALWTSALLTSRLAKRVLRAHWPFVLRQGVANLYRPSNQTRAVVLALGFGSFLIGTLYLVQRNLLNHLSLADGSTQANLAFFDIQEDQARGLDSLVRASSHPVLQQVPIVPMRIAAINGRGTGEISREHSSWALRREYRSSYRDSLIASERITAGSWRDRGESGLPGVSFEQDVAEELGLALGDTVTWDVQGVQIPTVVTSFREVNWARFEPNFFVLFPPAVLADAPQTFVLLTRAADPARRSLLQRQVVEHYPNVSSIDLSLIQEAVGDILGKISIAIRFMALFSIATGALVLLSAVAASRRQRLREGVLLKTLGATRSQIGRIMLSEYAVLGLLGSIVGILLSFAGAWALMRFVFDAPFTPIALPLLVLAALMTALTLSIGLWSSRDVFAATAMGALRGET